MLQDHLTSTPVPFDGAEESLNLWVIVAPVLVAVVLSALAVGCCIVYTKRRASAAEVGGATHAKEVPLTLAAACSSFCATS